MWLRLVYFLVFCAGWIIGFMAEFERWGVPPPRDFYLVNRRIVDMVKNQA